MNDEHDRLRSRLACLGDASRYRLALTLAHGRRCVTELARSVGLSQSCTTRHLQAMQRVGLVRGERAGKQVVFALADDEPALRLLLELHASDLRGTASTDAPKSPEASDAEPTDASIERGRRAGPAAVRPMPRAEEAERLPADASAAKRLDSGDESGESAPASRRIPPTDLEDYLL